MDRPENHETTGFEATCHGRQISQSATDKTSERLLGLEVREWNTFFYFCCLSYFLHFSLFLILNLSYNVRQITNTHNARTVPSYYSNAKKVLLITVKVCLQDIIKEKNCLPWEHRPAFLQGELRQDVVGVEHVGPVYPGLQEQTAEPVAVPATAGPPAARGRHTPPFSQPPAHSTPTSDTRAFQSYPETLNLYCLLLIYILYFF